MTCLTTQGNSLKEENGYKKSIFKGQDNFICFDQQCRKIPKKF